MSSLFFESVPVVTVFNRTSIFIHPLPASSIGTSGNVANPASMTSSNSRYLSDGYQSSRLTVGNKPISDMEINRSPDARQKDIILLLFAVFLAVSVVIVPALFPLFVLATLIVLAVFVEELVRRLEEYSDS